jgi:hypothetical protein
MVRNVWVSLWFGWMALGKGCGVTGFLGMMGFITDLSVGMFGLDAGAVEHIFTTSRHSLGRHCLYISLLLLDTRIVVD